MLSAVFLLSIGGNKSMGKKRLVTGIRPTGYLHLGHLEGMLKKTVNLQKEYECFPFIADWHSLTDRLNTEYLQEYTLNVAIDWLSAGIDPEKSVLFVQSHVPEHAELHVLLSMVTPVPWLERCPTYKDKVQSLEQKESASLGLLAYPVLQAADIIMYKGEVVPVGEDQLPHLEISREIARRFNNLYDNVFPEPQAILTEVPNLPGLDGRKMSKSYDNCIYLHDEPEEVTKKVMSMITDPARVRRNDPGHPDVCSIFAYHEIYNTEEIEQIEEDCKSAAIGCVECKKNLAQKLCQALAPFHEKRNEWASKPDKIKEMLKEGSTKAGEIAKQTMEEVRTAMNLKELEL